MEDICLNKILDNITSLGCEKGIVIASPSKKDPNYFYHWIRDSAVVIKTLIRRYKENNSIEIKNIILDYILTEIDLQNKNTISGLGEPKFNVNKSLFNENWGRPQNDGPALRALTFMEAYKNDIYIVPKKKFINNIIYKNIIYICENIHKPCFDIWEENYGYHLYTRLVQYKAIKEYLKIYKGTNFAFILKKYKEIKILINHHINKNIISSFDSNGKISRVYDSSVFLGLCHIDFDENIINSNLQLFKNYIKDIKNIFSKKYIINEKYGFTFLGRYEDDSYYNGQIWYICTIGLLRVLNKLNENREVTSFINYLKLLEDFNLSEQIKDLTMEKVSAKNLTWNYSELYNLLLEFKQ